MVKKNQLNIEMEEALKEFSNEEDTLKIQYDLNDLIHFDPLTKKQSILENYYNDNFNLIANGIAGTGKTFLILKLMMNDLLDPTTPYERIIIIRSAVTTRDIGFVPGTEEQKLQSFEEPYENICREIIKSNKSSNPYKALKNSDYIKFRSSSHLRGLTFKNSLIFIEEAENFNYHEIKTCVTRLGNNSKIFLSGDDEQTDLIKSRHDVNGFSKFRCIAELMSSFKMVDFDVDDIVRDDFVKEFYIKEKEYLNSLSQK